MTQLGTETLAMTPLWALAAFTLLTSVTAVIASTGFWAFIQRKDESKTATTQLLLGLAHDRIIFLGMKYIDIGSITTDEYEDYMRYLWEPYSHFGGNGLAEKVVAEVKQLPIKGMVNPIVRLIEEHHDNQPTRRAGDPIREPTAEQ